MTAWLQKLCFALFSLLAVAAVARAAEPDLTTLPTGTGLPVVVRVGVFFAELKAIDDVAKAFTATVDVRLVWNDLRLRFPANEASNGFKEYRGTAATARLGEIWSPALSLLNLQGEADYDSAGLRLFPDGRVELMRRVTGAFAASFDAERFPFDRQRLGIEIASQTDPNTRVLIDFWNSADFRATSACLDGA